ncbi:MAG: metalloregulator ArsR/SmtB family transcription factor [Micrococcaceae bacterium]
MKTHDIFTVIGDSTRRDILLLIKDEKQSVNTLVDRLGVTQPTVSKHLKTLREAGVVTKETKGRHRYYHLHSPSLLPLEGFLNSLDSTAEKTTSTTEEKIDKEKKKSLPRFNFPLIGKLRKD